jgi:hypothetical protein
MLIPSLERRGGWLKAIKPAAAATRWRRAGDLRRRPIWIAKTKSADT